MKKEEIKKYLGTDAEVKRLGVCKYGLVAKDGNVLAKSFSFKKYMNDIIRIEYTGFKYGTGDYIAKATDRINNLPDVILHRWK